MKLLKVKSREYNGKTYHKYRVNLPPKVIKQANLKEGDELDAEVIKKGEVRLKRK